MKGLSINKTLWCAILCMICLLMGSVSVYATDIEEANKQLRQTYDNVNSQESTSTTQQSSPAPDYGQGSVTDYLKGYTPVTQENMDKASSFSQPIVNFIGMLVGFILVITTALVGFITALDLLYIAAPPVRTFLYDGGGQQGGGMGMGAQGRYGGMQGGYGMQGGGMPGGMQQGQKRFRWVSDEVVATVALCQPASQMGGVGMQQGGAQQNMDTKSTISVYLKKRAFFLVFFAVASIVLLSSVFTNCGINVAALFMKIMAKINSSIGGAL